jgi:hypothetical protein
MEATAAGIDAETVMPAKRPRYALAAANRQDKTTASTIAFGVISGKEREAGMMGLVDWDGISGQSFMA